MQSLLLNCKFTLSSKVTDNVENDLDFFMPPKPWIITLVTALSQENN